MDKNQDLAELQLYNGVFRYLQRILQLIRNALILFLFFEGNEKLRVNLTVTMNPSVEMRAWGKATKQTAAGFVLDSAELWVS